MKGIFIMLRIPSLFKTTDSSQKAGPEQQPHGGLDVTKSMKKEGDKSQSDPEREKLKNILDDIAAAKNLASTLNESSGDEAINNLITKTDKAKHQLKDNRKILKLSKTDYQQMRAPYNRNQEPWLVHKGIRVGYGVTLAAV